MLKSQRLLFFVFISFSIGISLFSTGCANLGAPTGGPRDSIAPLLEKSNPVISATNVENNKITLTFNEYVDIQDAQTNVLVSPLQNESPLIKSNLKNITIKFRDTLQPNTTYSINFGNAIKDVTEGNVFKDFNYTFSTGSYVDSLSIGGVVTMAETGNFDSTVQVFLYQNPNDSSVLKTKPKYITRVATDGRFRFQNLPSGKFKIYALKDGDGSKTYNGPAEIFAFLPNDSLIVLTDSAQDIALSAYAVESREQNGAFPVTPNTGKSVEKNVNLRFQAAALSGGQDVLVPFSLNFSNPIKNLPDGRIYLADTNYTRIPNATQKLDSTKKILSIYPTWKANTDYVVIIDKEGILDSLNNKLFKSDTLRFTTKALTDYGKVLIRFKNIDMGRHPVLQLLQAGTIQKSYPLTGEEWRNNMFLPGEYEIRILYDTNENGYWDPGDYKLNIQPEQGITVKQKLGVRPDWENEMDITL